MSAAQDAGELKLPFDHKLLQQRGEVVLVAKLSPSTPEPVEFVVYRRDAAGYCHHGQYFLTRHNERALADALDAFANR